MDSEIDTNSTKSSSEILDERPQNDTSFVAPALICGAMDDESPDDVFISPPPPPTCEAPLLPTEGSRDKLASNSGMTFPNGAADASSTKANPNSLDMHHGEEHLMAVQDEMGEVTQSPIPSSKESVEDALPSSDENFTPTAYQDQTHMDGTDYPMELCHEKAGNYHQDNISGDEESNDEQEDTAVLCKEEENFMTNNANGESFLQQISSQTDETSENEGCLGKEGDKTKHEDICCLNERDFELPGWNVDGERVETHVPTLPGLTADDDNSKSSEKKEFGKFNQNVIEETINQSQVTSCNEGYVGSRFLEYSFTKSDCLTKESCTTETRTTHFSVCKGPEETAQQMDGSCRIATDIEQGEQLLERLQMLQIRQEEIPEAPQEINEARDEEQVKIRTEGKDERKRGKSVKSEEEEEGNELNTVKKEEEQANLAENNNNEEQVQTKTTFMSTTPEQSESVSLNNQSDSLASSDLSLDNRSETSCFEMTSVSTVHRFSAAETSMERQIHEAAQGKQNLQRAEGVFNLAGNPDVLEIPFKTNLSLESLITRVCTSQPSHLQFSETKMQKELSPEIQRKFRLVNQGKKPGSCSKGGVNQLKETKQLFEAFQQDNTKGLTRHWKPPSSVIKGDVYPSVLERTRSLEMFSLKTCPVTRVHSLKLYNSGTTNREKGPENLRSRSPENLRTKSPTGGREKPRLSPYPKHDKHLRLHRSMDSISGDASTSIKTKDKSKEGDINQDSPILRQNPFFKLRPALALQPEVQKDIQEAREREEELRRQRCKLYGEFKQKGEDEENSRCTQTLRSDDRKQSRGKLEHVWPPPSKKDQNKSEQTQQEVKVHTAGGQRARLWQRWESGLINEPALDEKK